MSLPDLNATFEQFARLRRAAIDLIDTVPADCRTTIPDGLRNNLHWQAGHILTVQASLLYRRCGAPSPVSEDYYSTFGKGTSPADWGGQAPAFETVRAMLDMSLDQLKTDIPSMADLKYPETITVSTGDKLSSFADALRFLPVHEAIHLGVITAMNRILTHETA